MRVLIVGDWHSELHEQTVFQALVSLGHEVDGIKWCQYFIPRGGLIFFLQHIVQRLQNKFIIGSLLQCLQRDLLEAVSSFKPEMLFVYRGTHIFPETLRKIKKNLPQCVLVGYNNDDPFSIDQPAYCWRHFIKGLPNYDLMLAYRHVNLDDYLYAGSGRVELLRSWYVPQRNYPVVLSAMEKENYESEVVFVGHYEADGRLEYLEEIVRHGIKLRIFGPGYDWDPIIKKSLLLRDLAPIKLVWGEDYNRALCGAKIALCFFSKLNRDTYTRRCFEIPASGTLLLSEYSKDLASLYRQGEEADFFSNIDEMINKIKRYLGDDEMRKTIAEAGRKRVIHDQHDVVSRIKKVIEWVQAMQANKT